MPEVPRPVKVILTAEAGHGTTLAGKRQRALSVLSVEEYSVEASMDSDADNFGLTIGDPYGDLVDLLLRDVEIRVQIFGGDDQTLFLKTGFCDTATMDYQGALTISGRDVSALAVDSDAPPNEWKNVRADKKIREQAIKLGFPATRLADAKKFQKIYTDGSETYWDFWYRMARKRKMWLWCEPDGTLVMDELNYTGNSGYYFGHSKGSGKWVPVTACEITSNKQTRVGEVHVFGESNDNPYYAHVFDQSIKHWLRKPNKIIFDSDISSKKEAQEIGYEEIFEGKVGSIEITLTIPDPGVIIRQNNLAELNLPEIGIVGQYYIVGTTIEGSSGSGFVQHVRLREKTMALSRRVPEDPELIRDENQDLASGTIFLDIPKPDWAQYFIAAAKQWCPSGIALDLFLASLLAICDIESNFKNIRSEVSGSSGKPSPYGRTGIEWYPAAAGNASEQHNNFANQSENRLTGFMEFAVGPMQLYTRSYKVDADQAYGVSGEYEGGRWQPRWNIWIAGKVLGVSKMAGKPHSRAGLMQAIHDYNGAGPSADAYMREAIRLIDTKYLPMVEMAFEAAQTLPASGAVIYLPGGGTVDTTNAPVFVRKAVSIALKQVGKPYVWGASGPNSFDCSGLCWYAYKSAGLAVGGRWTTYNLWPSRYRRVTKNELKVGDLVFFHGPPPSHMGMYLGDGNMVQAPSAGDVVKVSGIRSGYYAQSYVGGMRPVPWGPHT